MMERKAKFTIGERDVVGAMKLASERKLPIPTSAVMAVGIVAVILSYFVFDNRDSLVVNYLAPALAILIVLVALVQYVAIPWQARQHARQSVALQDEITLEWDEKDLRLAGDHGTMRVAWGEFHRWSENDAMILLYQSNMFFHLVPKSALSGEQSDDVTSRLKAAGVKKR